MIRHSRRRARGFSLIELGIVIAVIAVLAAVVIFGRGFIAASRITKAVEGMETIRKASSSYAGVQGGTLDSKGTSLVTTFRDRQLLPVPAGSTTWTINGQGSDQIIVNAIRGGNVVYNGAPTNIVLIQLKMPTMQMNQDVWQSVSTDNNLVKGTPVVDTLTCADGATQPTTAGPTNYCFTL